MCIGVCVYIKRKKGEILKKGKKRQVGEEGATQSSL